MAPAGGERGGIAGSFHVILGSFARGQRLGITLVADTGFILGRDPDTVRAPDIAFVRRERLMGGPLPKGFLPYAPDLAVEIISPSETAEEVQEKVLDYLNAGTSLVWLVYPRTKVVVVHSPGATRTLAEGAVLDGDDVLPGFQIPIADIFAE